MTFDLVTRNTTLRWTPWVWAGGVKGCAGVILICVFAIRRKWRNSLRLLVMKHCRDPLVFPEGFNISNMMTTVTYFYNSNFYNSENSHTYSLHLNTLCSLFSIMSLDLLSRQRSLFDFLKLLVDHGVRDRGCTEFIYPHPINVVTVLGQLIGRAVRSPIIIWGTLMNSIEVPKTDECSREESDHPTSECHTVVPATHRRKVMHLETMASIWRCKNAIVSSIHPAWVLLLNVDWIFIFGDAISKNTVCSLETF